MKTTMQWIAVLTLAAGMAAHAETAGSDKGGDKGECKASEKRQRPTPEQMAEKMMTNFDANKDSILSQAELTQALEAQRKNHKGGDKGEQKKEGGESDKDKRSERRGPPPADKVAARMIEKFSADKSGLKQAELTQALADRQAKRAEHADKKQGGKTEEDAN